jgi:hypothetical protein
LILILVFGSLLLVGGGVAAVLVLVPALLQGTPKGDAVAQARQQVLPERVAAPGDNGQQAPDQKAPAEQPQKEPEQPKPDPGELPKKDPVEPPKKDPVDIPRLDPVPPQPPAKPDKEVKQLPDTVGDVVVGGGGRFLIFHLPKARKLAVFDANEKKVTKYLPVAEDSVKIAACQDKLLVILPTANVIQRYSLETFEREVAVQSPTSNTVGLALLGSASRGPLVLFGEGKGVGQTEVLFLDPYTLKAIPDLKLGRAPWGVRGSSWRISGDGQVMTSYTPGSSPQGHTAYVRSGNEYKPNGLAGDAAGTMAPGPEGRFVYTARGMYTREGKPVGKMGAYGDGSRFCLPAAEGETFYLCIDVPGFPHGDRSGKTGNLFLHVAGEDRPLAALSQVEVPAGLNTWGREPFGTDKRFFLIPSAKLLVVLPATQDRLVVYRVDIDELLSKADHDYLVVLSRPPATARRGEAYSYQMNVKSKKGGVKYKLDSGPKGMEVSATGLLKWPVPADFAEPQTDVVVSITDAGEQELFHTFALNVGGKEVGADVAQLPPKPEAPKPDKDPPRPDKDPPKPDDAPRPDNKDPLGIRPAKLAQAQVVRQLPDTVGDVAVGGSGRFLIFHLPKARKLAVFDANEAKVVKYLPVAEDSPKIAACQDKLLVILPTANVIQRYSLETFEREVAVQSPTSNTVGLALLGSASRGPLVLFGEGKGVGQTEVLFLDPYTLKAIPGLKLRGALWGVRDSVWRISGDGQVLTSYQPNISPQGHTVHVRSGNEYKPNGLAGDAAGTMTPGPEGRFVYTARGMYTREGKPVGKMGAYGDGSRFCLPAADGETFYLCINVPGFPHGDDKQAGKLFLQVAGEDRPLAALSQVEVPAGLNTWGREPFGTDKRFFLIPSAKLLVVLPATQDRLLVYRTDIDELLAKADYDYLVVLSRPPAAAKPGAEYSYQMDVKSKRGGVKYKLDSGPKGMEVSATGLLKWPVPADFAEPQADVIMTISDASGQEIFHTFAITFPGNDKGGDVAVKPPPKPDEPGKLPPGAARYSDNGITFAYPKEWKVATEKADGVVTVIVQKDKGTQAIVQLHPAEADPKGVRTQLETAFRKAFEGKLVAGSEKAPKRKIAGAEREGVAMDFEVAKGVAIHLEVFAFSLGPKKPIVCIVFQHSAFDADAAKKGFDMIAASVEEKKD